MLGRTIGRFRIVGKLGEGGMGSVWKAEDTLLGRPVALKFLPETVATRPEARERFLREARATSALSHRGIARLYDAGEIDGRPYIAVEFVDGETVADRLARGPLAQREALRVAAEMADALDHAHARGILHRDVTARNVMLARDGHAVVIDLGLAARDDTTRLTTTGATIGTIPYIAPEVLLGESADTRSDLYGVGVVLYQMLTGQLPFACGTPAAALHAATHRRPDPPSQRRPGLDPGVDRLVLALLARDPARRPASAAALAVELRALIEATAAAPAYPSATPASGAPAATPAPTPRATAAARRCVAILPFHLVAPAGELSEQDEFLANGLAEALSARLAHAPMLRVVPPALVAEAQGADADTCALASRLGAHLLLQGSVRRSGPRVRVSYSLLDARRMRQVGGETFDGTTSDLFALEDALVASAVSALRVAVASRARPAHAWASPGAHETYLLALGYLQRGDSEAMVHEAVRLLRGLIASEGDTALVHAALGRAYLSLFEFTSDLSLRQRAEASCRMALELDPHAPEVLITLGRTQLRAGQPEEAARTLRQALELRPEDPEATLSLSRAYEAMGRFDRAAELAREAIRLRPQHWSGYNRLGMVAFRRGRYEEALAPWRRAVELTPDNAAVRLSLGAAYFQLGRLDEALGAFEASIGIVPTATACFGAGTVQFYRGDREAAVRMFERAVTLSPHDARAWGNLGDAQRWIPGFEEASRQSFEHAIALVREQLALNARDVDAWSRLALWQAKRGQTAESLVALDRALALRPEDVQALARAVTVRHLAGDRAGALQALAGALRGGYGLLELERDPELAALRGAPEAQELFRNAANARAAVAGSRHDHGEESWLCNHAEEPAG